MNKIIILIILIVFFVIIYGLEQVEVSFVSGDVKYLDNDQWITVKIGDKLSENTVIRCGTGSKVTLKIENSIFNITEGMTVRIKTIIDNINNQKHFNILTSMYNKFTKLFMGKSTEVHLAAMGVRGKDRVNALSNEEITEMMQEKPSFDIVSKLFKFRKYNEALEYLLSNNNLSKVNISRYNNLLGSIYYSLGNFHKAIEYLLSNAKKNQGNAFLIAMSYKYLGDFKKSNKVFKNLIKNFPNDKNIPEIYMMIALNFKAEGKISKEKRFLKNIIKKYSKSHVAQLARKEIDSLK